MEETPVQQAATDKIKEEKETTSSGGRKRILVFTGTAFILFLIALVTLLFMWSRSGKENTAEKPEAKEEHSEEANEVSLSSEALEAAGIELEGVTMRPAVARLEVTGTVELNQQQTQEVTPLVGGRIESVNVALGDRVAKGQTLATISSPTIAQMHGKLHEAVTRLELAERNLTRVQRSENRVAVLSAKAKLDEAEATLRRTKRIVELGAGAGKDLIAAEAAYKTAKAEYDFQSNISLNRELQEAQAEVETARVDVSHIVAEMRALGADVSEDGHDDHKKDSSLVALRAPLSGIVAERKVNAGAGVEAGSPLFSISNLSTVYVIANVPESLITILRVGTLAEVSGTALGQTITGSVSYIDPRLDETTRTARTRIEVVNPNEKLKAGMFVEVAFQAGTDKASGEELMVPSAAVQRIGERTVVFIPKEDEPGHFEARDVELGAEIEGYRRVISGLALGEKVITKGSFALKTQLMKGELGEHGH